MICPHCGTENDHGEHFCTECGAQLIEAKTNATIPGSGSGEMSAFPPGSSLQNGRYVITRSLGEGGMGSVLLAKDTRLADKQMVVKVLNAESTDTEKRQEDVRNFKREAETLAHLNHPLIPNVTDHFEEGARYFMVMDFVDGENLEKRIERTNQPMPEQDALTYALEVLDILEYLSQQQPAIVHRDIKPANIIIGTKDKYAHLVDFGIARANTTVNGQRRKTAALGTPGYAPPEQYQGFTDPRSDLYALAATLHHLVTNRDPGDHAPFQYPPARTVNPRVSLELEQVLEKGLQVKTGERYQTAQDMRRDVEAVLTKIGGSEQVGRTDGYRLTGSVPLRALPPREVKRPRQPISAFDMPEDTYRQATARRQQQQMQQPGYESSDYYSQEQGEQERQWQPLYRPQRRPAWEMRPDPFQRQGPLTPAQENQVMWNFIIFVVAICLIGILAYVIFGSLHL